MSQTFFNYYGILQDYENVHAKWCADLIANGRKTLQSISNSIDNDLLINLMESFTSFLVLLSECQPNSSKLSDQTENESQGLLLKKDIIKIVNSDLQCPICNEWLLKPTSANCNHTFCETCIHKWLKINKTCPVCRTSVQYTSTSIAVDNFITNLCDLFGGSTQGRRESVMNARIVEELINDLNTSRSFQHNTFISQHDTTIASHPNMGEIINDSNINQSIEDDTSVSQDDASVSQDDTSVSQDDTTTAMSHPNMGEIINDSNINQSIENDTFISQHDTTSVMSHPNMVRLIPCPPTPTSRRNSRQPIVSPNMPHPNTVQLLPFPQPSTASASSLTYSNRLE